MGCDDNFQLCISLFADDGKGKLYHANRWIPPCGCCVSRPAWFAPQLLPKGNSWAGLKGFAGPGSGPHAGLLLLYKHCLFKLLRDD
jgi:hypothetical protein